MRAMFSILSFVAAAALGAACGNVASQTHEMTPDAGPDAPAPLTCSSLTCDANAACAMTDTGAACACKAGFTGGGKTCQDIDECATMPYGAAMDCRASSSHAGLANIGLTGTLFVLDAAAMFATGGSNPGGMAQISTDRARVKLSGGGSCGWIGPAGTPADPFNNNVASGLLLKLAYAP